MGITRLHTILLLSLGLQATPMLAQTQIGGGTCDSSFLNGTYDFTMTGRQLSATGSFSNVFQANGSVTFDGLNKVGITMTADTSQAVATSLTWSGTYSLQANCAGAVNITSGNTATLTLAVYNQGKGFLVTGSDATYAYTGGGNTQPTGCLASLLSGVYAFNGTGYTLSGAAVNGIGNATGLLQFDGQSAVTANFTLSSAGQTPSAITLTGTYSVSSSCLASATLTDSKSNSYNLAISITNSNKVATLDFDVLMAQASKWTITGAGHAVYGQPVASGTPTPITGNCSAASLNGTYAATLNGRAVSTSGAFTGSYQANGTATFDGQSKVVFTVAANTNLAQGKPFTYTGTYTIPANCSGTMSLPITGTAAAFTLVAWGSGADFTIAGEDGTYAYSGGGTSPPAACVTATLSGEYTYSGNGFLLSGTAVHAAADENGVLQFDGQGNLTAAYTITSGGTSSPTTATGTYTLGANCMGSATLMDSSGVSNSLSFSVSNATGATFDVDEANSGFIRAGTAHSAFLNPSQYIGNVASYAVGATPPGSVFVLFGTNVATRTANALSVPLPNTLLTTSVTVNGENAPLFYVDTGQIDAQIPWDIPGGSMATVIVKNGSATSNAAAVFVPATGTPGLSVYGNNRAVVVNQNGTENSPTAAAAVGDEVVAYFTGGGPVQETGKLVTGALAPLSLAPLTENSTVTVGGIPATTPYIGLTPGSIGLYQANFYVPQIAKGTYPVVITIAGQASNAPLMTVSN